MKREIVYCDKCREQMTVIDDDGDPQITGYVLRGRNGGGLFLSHSKYAAGSSSSSSGEFAGTHFCSDACLLLSLEEFLKTTKITLILP